MPRIKFHVARSLMIAGLFGLAAPVSAIDETSVSPPPVPSISQSVTLEDLLISRLRATTEDQRAYLRYVVKQVGLGKLEVKLLVALQRYAIRRNPNFPFPFFEAALRYEANKRGVPLPPSREFSLRRTVPHPTR